MDREEAEKVLVAARDRLNDAAWQIKYGEDLAFRFRVVHEAMLAKVRECETVLAAPKEVPA
jgi:hypothetical protein